MSVKPLVLPQARRQPRKILPRSLDELRGLRAARWVRESTAGQYDHYGPDSQHEQMDRFVERFRLVDTGIVYTVAQSGRTVWRSEAMGMMLAAARDGSFDVLLTGYFDRWQRNLRRTLELIEDHLHPSGVAWAMCDRRLLSSDPRDWDQMVTEAHEAERYSRRLGEGIADGYAVKFNRFADQGGHAPLGFQRVPPSFVLAIDPDTVGIAVRLFERYASGILSIEEVAREFGLNDRRVNEMLKNPIYNGWVGRKGELLPASWRSEPPVSDELWERVARLRLSRMRHGPRGTSHRADLLRGLLFCSCGRRIRSDGTMGTPPRIRKMHPEHRLCPDWGWQASHSAEAYEPWIVSQVLGVKTDDETVAGIVATVSADASAPQRPGASRFDEARRSLALEHAAGRIDDEAYLAKAASLRIEAEQAASSKPSARPPFPPDRIVEKLKAIPEAWKRATPDGKAELLNSIYERIVVRGEEIVRVRLTPDAYAQGLDKALPEEVELAPEWVLARPTGFDFPGAIPESKPIQIKGARVWRALVEVRTA